MRTLPLRAARRKRERRWGIDLFIEDGAYTTLAAAVSILVVLTLLISSVTATWSMSRAGDVQVSADATALAGANVVSSYTTAATVVDACIASLGLAGMLTTGAGLVLTLIPETAAVSVEVINAGRKILQARDNFAKKASKGLSGLERALPYLVALNGLRTCAAQSEGDLTYTGVAIPVPFESASDFSALEETETDTEELEETADELDQAAEDQREAAEDTADAKEEAWLADCGRPGRNMQERAASLTSLTSAQNPDYQSSVSWTPEVALRRARAYYRWRIDHEKPEHGDTESEADSAARRAFYTYALEKMNAASVTVVGDRMVSTVEQLPKNTDEVKKTRLYTDVMWPSTEEGAGLTLHYSSSCPGATGKAGPNLALSSIDTGVARECPTCKFSVGDLGKTPAASTSISTGFEYHLRAFIQALDEYVACSNREFELENELEDEAEDSANVFEEVLGSIGSVRPHIAPPGRYGCIAFAISGEITSPEILDADADERVVLDPRGAISAAVLAPEKANFKSNVLASFFSNLERQAGLLGVTGILDVVMDLWGALLVAYGNAGEGISALFDSLISGLDGIGLGPVAVFLRDKLVGIIEGLGLQPVDMRLKKPVLTDTSNVIAQSGIPALADAEELLRKLPIGVDDPITLLKSLGFDGIERITATEITLVEIEIPGFAPIPITIRIQDILEGIGL